jgi:hypothetical protein
MEYGPWQGGHHAGRVYQATGCPNAFRLKLRQIQCDERFSDEDSAVARTMADERRVELSIQLGLTKNRYRLVSDPETREQWYEMNLTRGKTMLFDVADLAFTTSRIWATMATKSGFYACTMVNGKLKYFHSLVTGFSMVDHIDRDGLNNRRGNLRETTRFENARNRGTNPKNTTGRTGVSSTLGKYYYATWSDLDGKNCRKAFSWNKYGQEEAYRLAVAHRIAMEEKYYCYVKAPDDTTGQIHEALVQEKITNKPFACPLCAFKTAYKCDIPLHISRKHPTQ